MKLTKIQSSQLDNVLEIRWCINNVCNFKCEYCFPDAHAATHSSPTNLTHVVDNFNHLFDYYKSHLGKTSFNLKITGGEPTLWPELGEFIQEIKQKHKVYVTVLSNGSRTMRWWKEYAPYIDNLTLSYHQKQADIHHTIQVADLLFALKKKVTVHMLMDPTCWDKCLEDIEHIKNTSIHPWFIQTKEIISTPNMPIAYTTNQRQYLQKELKRMPNLLWFIKNFKLIFGGQIRFFESRATTDNNKTIFAQSQTYITRQLNTFKGWRCNLGLESIYIHWNGNIQGSCGQLPYTGNNIHNILDKDFKLTFQPTLSPVTCMRNCCECPPETHLTKISFS